MPEIRRLVSTRLKLKELQDICVGLGISTCGRKKDLLKRINDKINNVDEGEVDESIIGNQEGLEQTSDPDFRFFREEQDREYEEGLRQDRIKGVERLVSEKKYSEISISDMKLYMDSKNISYTNVIEKSDLIGLLSESIEGSANKDMDETEEEDIQLNIEELRLARLKFYNNVQ